MKINIDFENQTIGSNDSDDVDPVSLYSYLKEVWRNSDESMKFAFPIKLTDDRGFEFVGSWQPKNRKFVNSIKGVRVRYTKVFDVFDGDDDLFEI